MPLTWQRSPAINLVGSEDEVHGNDSGTQCWQNERGQGVSCGKLRWVFGRQRQTITTFTTSSGRASFEGGLMSKQHTPPILKVPSCSGADGPDPHLAPVFGAAAYGASRFPGCNTLQCTVGGRCAVRCELPLLSFESFPAVSRHDAGGKIIHFGRMYTWCGVEFPSSTASTQPRNFPEMGHYVVVLRPRAFTIGS